MTPGAESTHYSTASQVPGRELFAATENFLSRAGARLSFGTPASARVSEKRGNLDGNR